MKWTPKDKFKWHACYAFRPVKVNDTFMWLEWLERRAQIRRSYSYNKKIRWEYRVPFKPERRRWCRLFRKKKTVVGEPPANREVNLEA